MFWSYHLNWIFLTLIKSLSCAADCRSLQVMKIPTEPTFLLHCLQLNETLFFLNLSFHLMYYQLVSSVQASSITGINMT